MTSDLIQQVQEAVDSHILGEHDEGKEAFLKYLNEDLKTQATLALNYLNTATKLEFKVLDSCSDNGTNCKRTSLGIHNFPNEQRTHQHGPFDVRFESRQVTAEAYAEFTHPEIDDIWDDVKGCAIGAAVAAVVTLIVIEDIATAEAIFYPSFYTCLVELIGDRGKEVVVKLESGEKERSCWTYHC
ncbi:hypothetical protein D1872_98280 [compost metagenome]